MSEKVFISSMYLAHIEPSNFLVDKCERYSDCMQAFCTFALKTVEKNVIDFFSGLSTETLPNIKLPVIIK